MARLDQRLAILAAALCLGVAGCDSSETCDQATVTAAVDGVTCTDPAGFATCSYTIHVDPDGNPATADDVRTATGPNATSPFSASFDVAGLSASYYVYVELDCGGSSWVAGYYGPDYFTKPASPNAAFACGARFDVKFCD